MGKPYLKIIGKDITDKEKDYIFNKFYGRCAYCACGLDFGVNFTIDHVIPKTNFRVAIANRKNIPEFLDHILITDSYNFLDNLFPACAECNHKKGKLSLEEFRDKGQKFYFEKF